MGPLIRLLLLAAAIWFAWRIYLALRDRRKAANDAGERPRLTENQELIECPHCGVHLPRRDAVTVDGLAYCSEGAAERLADRNGD